MPASAKAPVNVNVCPRTPGLGSGGAIEVTTGATIDAATEKLTATLPVGKRPWGIAVTRDGKRLYTANGLSNDVSVIDTATLKVIATIPAGKGAWGVEIGSADAAYRELFTHLAVPVMTRLRQPQRLVLDTLVEAGVARSRSEAKVVQPSSLHRASRSSRKRGS